MPKKPKRSPKDYNPPQQLGDTKLKYTHTPFKTQAALFEFFDNIVPTHEKMPKGSRYYDTFLNDEINDWKRDITTNEWRSGIPLPRSWDDAMARTRYQNMDEFNRVYNDVIKPLVQNLLQDSKAAFEVPTLKYNDRGLGSFDFAKASIGLIAVDKYYSFKKKDFVDKIEVKTYKDNNKFKYKLVTDGSPVVIVPKVKDGDKEEMKEIVDKAYKEIYEGANVFKTLKKYKLKVGGKGSITSTIKKCYIAKEQVVKPKNAVRIFIKIGGNCDIGYDRYRWSGYTAIGIAELLIQMGYSVCIIGIWGLYMTSDGYNDNGKMKSGIRSYSAIIKNFDESMDTPSLLYTFSDLSFFRAKIFKYYIQHAFLYKDYIDGFLGSTAYLEDAGGHGLGVKTIAYNEYGKRDKLFNKEGVLDKGSQFLYYMLGDIYSEQEMATIINDIGLHVVDENLEARRKMGIN